MPPGDHDLETARATLTQRLPEPLAPLARAAYNYRWSWAPDGGATFAAVDPDRWERVGMNPVRLLATASPDRVAAAASDDTLVGRASRLATLIEAERQRPARSGPWSRERPVAFMCAEFGVHASLPVYSGGLGVLAGDILKEASDLALPMIGVGLFYRSGYFHQRLDTTGMQHEYWEQNDPSALPCALVTDPTTGRPLTVAVPVGDDDVTVQAWRVDVGS